MRRHSYQIYHHAPDTEKTIINRKMTILLDLKGKPVCHSDGHLLVFYSKRDAIAYIRKQKTINVWRTKRINLGITIA